jgi:hypothetical protein
LRSASRRLAFGLLLWAVLGAPVQAQTASATLAGKVLTEDGEPVSDAVVRARFESTGAVRTTVSDASGRYRISGLSPGQWTVVAQLGEGALSETRVVQLRLQQTTKLDFTVGRGQVEHVVVRAAAPLVDRKETAGKLSVTRDQADALPIAGRVFTDLALLDSSVRQAAPGNYFGERGAVFQVNGQGGRSNSFLVDGLDNNDSTSGTTVNSFFSQQVIEEFVLLTHQYSPEFGRASGGMLNIVTRRGSNQPGWGAFVQGTDDRWNNEGEFVAGLPDSGATREAIGRFQTGFSVEGPMRKDRAFYFFAYEHQDADAVIPYTGIDRDGVGGGRLVAPSKNDNFFLRTDFNLGRSNTLMVRLSGDDRSAEGINVGGVWTPEAGFRIEESDLQLAASLTTVVSPDLLSETRLLASLSKFDQFANSDLPGVNRPSGIFGGNALNRQQRDEQKFQLVQNLTWRRGAHTLKFGIDITHSKTDVMARFNPNGNYTYNYDIPFEPGDCGNIQVTQIPFAAPDGTVDCLGEPNGMDNDGDGDIDEQANIFSYPLVFSLIDGEPEATLDDTQISLFAQDKAEVGSRWLLDYGFRYDVSTFELPAGARVDSTIPNGGAKRDTDNIAPRFGFTFTPKPGGSLVIRGGGGLFYDKLVLAFPAVAAITSDTTIGLFFPQGLAEERTENTPNGGDLPLLFPEPLIMRFSTAPELETPYTVQYNLGFERKLGSHGALRYNVVRALGYHLPLMRDLNPVAGLIDAADAFPVLLGIAEECPVDAIVPDLDVGLPCHANDPRRGSIAALVTEGRSWYTGLDLSYRWQRDGSWLNASYTLSEGEDTGFDPLKGGISLPPTSDGIRTQRGRSDGDREHRLVVSAESVVPWWGLRVSGVVQLSSGIPFDITTGQDDNLDGILTDRPPGVSRNAGEDAWIAAINAVRDQPVVPLDPINSLNEPSFFQIDTRVTKPFAFRGGRGGGQFYVQIINLLDRSNGGLIEGRAISPNFGKVIGLAGPPRTLEVGLAVGY